MSLPSNFGRAVDLSSLGKQPVSASQAASGIEVTAANLTTEILPLSKTKVVVLLCFSSRSPESLSVMQILVKLQSESNGVWEFATVNIDTQPQVAQALQVRTVPYAVALVAEQLVPLFEQSYPETQIRSVIEKVLAIAAEQGVGEAVEEKTEPEEEEALAALEVRDYDRAESAYKALLVRKPNDPYAKVGLAQTQLMARTLGLDREKAVQAADGSPDDVALQIQAADCEVLAGDIDSAFGRLLACIRSLSGDERIRVKDHLLELFSLVDPSDPRLVKARGALASALY